MANMAEYKRVLTDEMSVEILKALRGESFFTPDMDPYSEKYEGSERLYYRSSIPAGYRYFYRALWCGSGGGPAYTYLKTAYETVFGYFVGNNRNDASKGLPTPWQS